MSMWNHYMITSPDEKGVIVIGGDLKPGNTQQDKIYELKCTNSLETCKWVTLQQKLKYARESFVAMLIPDSLAHDLCV